MTKNRQVHADAQTADHVVKQSEDVRERQNAQIGFAAAVREVARDEVYVAADVAHGEHHTLRRAGRAACVHDAAQVVHFAFRIGDILLFEAVRMRFGEYLLAAGIDVGECSARREQFAALVSIAASSAGISSKFIFANVDFSV